MGSYVAEITTIIKLEGIEDFIGIGPIIEVLRGIDIETLDNKHKETVNAFNEAVERREKGITDGW